MTDLDELISRDPLTLTKDDIRSIIHYNRQYLAKLASGEKRPNEPTQSLNKLLKLAASPKPTAPIRRLK